MTNRLDSRDDIIKAIALDARSRNSGPEETADENPDEWAARGAGLQKIQEALDDHGAKLDMVIEHIANEETEKWTDVVKKIKKARRPEASAQPRDSVRSPTTNTGHRYAG